jgi:uroporphyrinogen-III synthase
VSVPALQGVGVLVTRPAGQATPLCRLLEAAGATVTRLPAIDIRPTGDIPELMRVSQAGGGFDMVIFTSANAVRFGAPLLAALKVDATVLAAPMRDSPALAAQGDPTIAALGPATARALADLGHRVTVIPAGGFDSEHLLLHPLLHQMDGRRVLIVTGAHGRGLLSEELGRRGARVIIAEVYRRERAHHEAPQLEALAARLAAGEIQVVTATSAEIAASLLDAATPGLRLAFDRVHWLVPGSRVAAAVRERGLGAPLLQADSADDQDLLAAIIRWRESGSAA